MQKINESLISRGFVTWFDLVNMKGGGQMTVRCMSCLVLLVLCATVGELNDHALQGLQ